MEFIENTSTITTETDDGIVILDQKKGVYWHLNATAAEILKSLKKDSDKNMTVTEIKNRYDIEESRAREDVEDLIRSLESLGLIRR